MLKELIEGFDNKRQPDQPYVIAEAGVNHEGSMELAKELIDSAKEGGANAIKFQTYKAGFLAVKDSPAYWDLEKEPTESQFELFKKNDSFWEHEFKELASYSHSVGIEFLSTPFDCESASFLNEMMDVFKISSSDLDNRPFIEYLCGFGKPILISTGAARVGEIQDAVDWIKGKGNAVGIMHCMLDYPTKDKDANLLVIRQLRDLYPNDIVGYSDHTVPGDMENLVLAGLLGADIIEKHFTLDKTLQGNDHYHAMDKHDLAIFLDRMKSYKQRLGCYRDSEFPNELSARKHARRSLVSTRPLNKGKVIERTDLTWKRPGHGISPSLIDRLIGRLAKVDIKEDTVLTWEMIEGAD